MQNGRNTAAGARQRVFSMLLLLTHSLCEGLTFQSLSFTICETSPALTVACQGTEEAVSDSEAL